MDKQEFLLKLRKELSGLPREDLEERLTFYSEMIDDRMEEGVSEEEAVAAAGSVDEILWQTVEEVPLQKIAKEKINGSRQLKVWEIVLLALGAPIWLSLLVSVFAVVLSVYVSLWAGIISLWAVFTSVAACALGAFLSSISFMIDGFGAEGLAMIGAGLVCVGLSIFLFYGCKAVTNGTAVLTKKCVLSVKKRLVRREEA